MRDVYKHISLTLRELRHDRGWSLDKAAEETGVSKAMLGQIERQESSPTIATLWKIASGFQTSFSSFIANIDVDSEEPIHRSGKTSNIHLQDDKIRVMTLFPFDKELNFEIFTIDLSPGCEQLSPPHKHGVTEHVLVLEGKIDVFINGHWRTLNKREGIRFNADQPHGYRNTTRVSACFNNIIHYAPIKNQSAL